MTIHHDLDKGWAISDGTPPWRCALAALRRVEGRPFTWTNLPRRAWVASIGGKPVATVRLYPARRRWAMRIDGFEFWKDVHCMGREMYTAVAGFDRVDDARKFVETVLTQAGAYKP